MMVRVVKETDRGIVVRGAKHEPRQPMRTTRSSRHSRRLGR
jgi:aromatic ring hydroxylase